MLERTALRTGTGGWHDTMTPQDIPPSPPLKTTVEVATAIGLVDAQAWDACANPAGGTSADPHEDWRNPFLSHAFLSALEASESAVIETGWSPAHILVRSADGVLAGAVPCYLKSHSRGEYVFDQGWADAFQRAGGEYYPKLQVSIPFTPATGRRLLVRPDFEAAGTRNMLVSGLRALREKTRASSIHVTFLPEADWELLGAKGFLKRKDQQFHWWNDGFQSFDQFLETLASRKRKTIRKERRDALANGITIEHLTGSDITEAHWDVFYEFYQDTGARKWGRPYLTRSFYSLIGASMADQILLVMAKRGGRYIAGAINFIGANTLYGRHWGCIEEHPFLHFEVCYYQAIDFAIARGLTRVEAGAQGEHKLARGYRPTFTYSAHDIANPSFRRAIEDYLQREHSYVDAVQTQFEEMTPFRKDNRCE